MSSREHHNLNSVRGVFLGLIGEDPSVSKSIPLHASDSLLSIQGIFHTDSSKMIGTFPKLVNFNWLFLKLNRFICNYTFVSN